MMNHGSVVPIVHDRGMVETQSQHRKLEFQPTCLMLLLFVRLFQFPYCRRTLFKLPPRPPDLVPASRCVPDQMRLTSVCMHEAAVGCAHPSPSTRPELRLFSMPSSVSSAASSPSYVSHQNGLEQFAATSRQENGKTIEHNNRFESTSTPSSPASLARYTAPQAMYRNKFASVNGSHSQTILPALQANNGLADDRRLDPVEEDDPRSFNLVTSDDAAGKEYSLEKSSQILFSNDHLQVLFADPALLLQFTTFLGVHRPQSVPMLVHYLDSLKSLRALHYANAICEGLDPVDGLEFTQTPLKPTINATLEARATAAFNILAREELPAFITHQYIQIVSASITARITGSLPPHLREASEGLAEVFCLTDPSRQDNPIVFASEGSTSSLSVICR